MREPSPREIPLTSSAFTLVRHGQTTYNASERLNGDPSVPVHLDKTGRAQCATLAAQLRHESFDVAVHTGFPRTRESLGILLDGRDIPIVVIPELGDVHLGIFEGQPVREYRAWRRTRPPSDRPPGGESRIDALARYVLGTDRLLNLEGASVLAVLHDVPIRFIANAGHGDDPVDGPITSVANTEVYRLDRPAMMAARGVMRDRVASAATAPQ
jgi:broad specificity phosphatase PhoE